MHCNKRKCLLIAAYSAGLICLLVFLRSLWCGFINLDDAFYVEHNPLINGLDGKTLQRLFTEPQQGAWLPLTIVTFAIDNFFWRGNPAGYHLTNILLHAVNAMLVVLLADRLFQSSDSRCEIIRNDRYLYPAMLLLTGLLFGIHPMRVESVTWVSERKDVLNGLFTFSSVLFYLRYVQKRSLPGENRAAVRAYCMSVGLYSLSLMSKQVSVVLPVMLLVIDWFPLERLGKVKLVPLLIEKVPYLVLSLALSFITISWASKGNMMIAADDFPFYARCLVSGNDVFEYCRYLLYPVGIVPYFVIGDSIQVSFIVKTAVVVAFTCFCAGSARRWPSFGAVWACFLLPLLPVMAFTQSADDTAIASRYTYLPSVAPSIAAGILLVVGYLSVAKNTPRLARILIPSLIAVLLLCYGALTFRLIAAWQDTGTLWTRQIEVQPLGRAYIYRGIFSSSTGDNHAAINDFSIAIKIAQQAGRDDVFNLYAYRGEALRALGMHEAAIDDFTVAINMSQQPLYYYFRGSSLKALGRFTEAEEDFSRAGNHSGPLPWFPTKYNQGKEKK